jgi:hypothetical protein
LYALAKAPASLVNSYAQAVMAISTAAFHTQLLPLDNDPDFIYYGTLFGSGGGAPDFHPRVQSMCTTDRSVTHKSVGLLIDNIQGKHTGDQDIPSVAEVMAQSFLGLYEGALARFQAILKAQDPPAPPQMLSLAQSQIPDLTTKIDELTKFLQTIQAGGGH